MKETGVSKDWPPLWKTAVSSVLPLKYLVFVTDCPFGDDLAGRREPQPCMMVASLRYERFPLRLRRIVVSSDEPPYGLLVAGFGLP